MAKRTKTAGEAAVDHETVRRIQVRTLELVAKRLSEDADEVDAAAPAVAEGYRRAAAQIGLIAAELGQ